ncbi:MAG: radical SAM family heme chaperone HemW [Deltaproteobacteria bacterium]|jgi:oxygen-independent coproporphyrinogen-3 oxidase|nr:radical SAM family heme chaperone HemW [Deltaproteobacteria bacterium]
MSSEPLHGLYIHVPFCSRKCPYCDFYSVNSLHQIPDYTKALALEVTSQIRYWHEGFDTLYLGGGSPSLLERDDLSEVKKAISPLSVSSRAEITLEANPEDVTIDKVKFWADWGVNRISLGVQSFSQEVLFHSLGRSHTKQHNYDAISFIKKVGLNLSLDLIYGWSGQTPEDWEADLKVALSFSPKHISAYSLTPSRGTPLYYNLERGLHPPLPPEDTVAELFLMTACILGDGGFQHYEVSNFARRGQVCRHNLKYWRREPYLGLGPAAHSFDGIRRYANLSSLQDWIMALHSGRTHRDFIEDIDLEQAKLESVMLGLRLSEGLSTSQVKGSEKLEFLIEEGYLIQDGNKVIPSEKGFLAADYLARTLV